MLALSSLSVLLNGKRILDGTHDSQVVHVASMQMTIPDDDSGTANGTVGHKISYSGDSERGLDKQSYQKV